MYRCMYELCFNLNPVKVIKCTSKVIQISPHNCATFMYVAKLFVWLLGDWGGRCFPILSISTSCWLKGHSLPSTHHSYKSFSQDLVFVVTKSVFKKVFRNYDLFFSLCLSHTYCEVFLCYVSHKGINFISTSSPKVTFPTINVPPHVCLPELHSLFNSIIMRRQALAAPKICERLIELNKKCSSDKQKLALEREHRKTSG